MEKTHRQHKILIVEDSPVNAKVLEGVLKSYYQSDIAHSGLSALEIAGSDAPPDLILLDIIMPGMDGYEVCRKLKADDKTKNIPVIFMTAKSRVEDETLGFDLGAVDYITKPVSPPIVLARVRTHLELKDAKEALEDENVRLEKKVQEGTEELALTQDAIILSLTSLIETRGNETGGHLKRTQHFVRVLVERLVTHYKFSHFLTDQSVDLLFKSTPLHDIGKVGVQDAILLKPGKLTHEEFEEMKKHTAYGRDTLVQMEKAFKGRSAAPFLGIARVMAYTHHEKWDGSGYPEGSSEADIPIPGRLMAIADVYDALISKRVYKPAFHHSEAEEIIAQARGKLFDPDIVDVFFRVRDEFRKIALTYADFQEERRLLSK
jgi:putative two-component system response regulator